MKLFTTIKNYSWKKHFKNMLDIIGLETHDDDNYNTIWTPESMDRAIKHQAKINEERIRRGEEPEYIIF